ncbi:hypothetical protein SPHINGO8BC_90422 [Sphingobacterium multivorum]|uniref:Response regulator n=1 Tax=Sphingobacterium multivorum TaxID=28454 RepID=A0A654DV60_SPHMU|nr:hypothetical protein SPHINGO8BC_90422 [Sphingobacterium multivorum]
MEQFFALFRTTIFIKILHLKIVILIAVETAGIKVVVVDDDRILS